MISVESQNTVHKAWMLRVLTEIAKDDLLTKQLIFKGGTCASMMGILNRFSVDLDFDILNLEKTPEIRKAFYNIFTKLELSVKDESKNVVEFFVKYPAKENERSILKIDAVVGVFKNAVNAPMYLPEISRTLMCQTKETIFSHKLVALKERYDKKEAIAGRDLYDIHYFFFQGLRYIPELIEERTKKSPSAYFKELVGFIESKMDQENIDRDLNTLLLTKEFHKVRKILKQEAIFFLNQEISRLDNA